MPNSLESSKRKFHKLLENLTSDRAERPSTPDASLSASAGASKRLRLTPRSRLAASHPLVNSSTNLRAIRRVPSHAVNRAPDEDESKIPNYAPWNRDHFKRRLKTFSNASWWSSKPAAVNEVAWAKRGWVCEGKNRVACKGGCEARVAVHLRPRLKDQNGQDIDGTEDVDADVAEELVKSVEKTIIEGHQDDCLWRSAGCSEDIMRMPLARPNIWQPALQGRYESFVMCRASLPSVAGIKQPCDLEGVNRQLGPDFFHAQGESTLAEVDRAALAFALLGWHAPTDATPDAYPTASCSECFRRIGLWLYAKRPPSSSSNYSKLARSSLLDRPASDDDSAPGTTLPEVNEDSDALDLIDSHKSFCPWVNAVSQATPGPLAGLSGYQIMQKVISNWSGFKARTESLRTRYDPEPAENKDDTSCEGTEPFPSVLVEQPPEADAEVNEVSSALTSAEIYKSLEEGRKQDDARFARLKEISKIFGFKNLKGRTARAHPPGL